MEKNAYFAGGCFWGTEKFMSMIPGVTDVVSGFANGDNENFPNPTYQMVCNEKTGYKETVRVSYDPSAVSYEFLVRAFYLSIDPTVKKRQGNDIGSQYQSGIYYSDDAQREAALRVSEEIKAQVSEFHVELEPIRNFYLAEEYHQDYLEKNPGGYCHIGLEEMQELREMIEKSSGTGYVKPSEDLIKEKLSDSQYAVTQKAATEPPFDNEMWDHFEKGIYVDIVSGEPLFSSEDKYKSSCGWPAFSQPKADIQYLRDSSHGMNRVEVRSPIADSHLGHVFNNDPESPTGIRYCINSASLEFIPYDELDSRGCGYAKEWFN